jgi:hypothetical protein
MHLVGARFADRSAADAAIAELRARITVEPGDLGLRPLGSLRYDEPVQGLVVAGRFEGPDVDAVVQIMQSHGGEIVFRRAEWRNPRSHARGSDRSIARCQRPTFPRR